MPTSIRASASTEAQALGRAAPRSLWGEAFLRLRRSKSALLGGIILAGLIAAAAAAPLLTPWDPLEMNAVDGLQPPSARHWFGTDILGRDLFTRILVGARSALETGLVSVTIAILIGVPVGLSAGFYGGLTNCSMMRLV